MWNFTCLLNLKWKKLRVPNICFRERNLVCEAQVFTTRLHLRPLGKSVYIVTPSWKKPRATSLVIKMLMKCFCWVWIIILQCNCSCVLLKWPWQLTESEALGRLTDLVKWLKNRKDVSVKGKMCFLPDFLFTCWCGAWGRKISRESDSSACAKWCLVFREWRPRHGSYVNETFPLCSIYSPMGREKLL